MSLVEVLCVGILTIPGITPKVAKNTCDNYVPKVIRAAKRYDVDPSLILSVMYIESSYNRRAVSPANACGLMQIIPKYSGTFRRGTRRSYTCEQLKLPKLAIDLGTKIYSKLLGMAKFNENMALCYYNAGPSGCYRIFKGSQGKIDNSRYVKKVRKIQKIILSKKDLISE